MRKVALATIGCRLNQYETEKIAFQLTQCGFQRVDFDQDADLYIVNTCTVTGRADSSCRNIISRATRKRGHPPVVVVGCYVDSDPEKMAGLNGVHLVVNNRNKGKIAGILQERFPELFENGKQVTQTDHIREFSQHNRAWIKIGDGCNQRCSYCIIPVVRGELINRPANEIINEISILSGNGYNEVVLTGVHIGQYSYGDIKSVADLLRYILAETDISRIRLSSIEPQEVNSGLIKTMAEGGKRICRHLHIPLQSGSDRILKAMRRPYNVGEYLEIVKRARESIKNVTIGADIIVGFPGETDEDFRQSVSAAETGLLDYLHVFSYSDRPGTEALKLSDKVRPDIIKVRNCILREISQSSYTSALKGAVGEIAHVISEHKSERGEHYWGITDNYLKVLIPESVGGGKEILKMKITGATEKYLTGEII